MRLGRALPATVDVASLSVDALLDAGGPVARRRLPGDPRG